MIGAVAMMSFTSATFAGRAEFGQFADAGAVAAGIEKYAGRLPGVLFAVALIDACIIGASAVSLSTAYALGDVFSARHSLHRKPSDAKLFYAFFFGLIVVAAALVLTPGTPLGLLTNLVQTLAGVLLPSATVFLLLLCNDSAVLGPWVNSRTINVATASVIAVLVMLSVILTASVLFPGMDSEDILTVLIGCIVAAGVLAFALAIMQRKWPREQPVVSAQTEADRSLWRMPPLHQLPRARLSLSSEVWMFVLRAYLILAGGMLVAKIAQLAIHHSSLP